MAKAAQLMRDRHDAISKIMVMEQGKPYVEARGEVIVSADIIDWYAEEGRRSYGRIVPGRGKGVRQLVMQEPIGVVAAFTPWNFPVLTPARKIGGALAAGCSLILKASEETPGACVEMVKCFADAGLPAGVLNLVFGVPSEVSEHLLAKDAVRKISFTGSIPVGKHLAQLAAKGMKRTTMELGGHSPVVVFGDADPEKAADTIAAFKYRNAGQVCISPTRFYVQEDVYKKFLARFTEYAKGIKVGDGLEKGIGMGPLANSRRLDAMDAIVADAKDRGGKIQVGGTRRGNQGYFYEPTVITDVPDDFEDHDAGAVRAGGADRHLQDLRRGGASAPTRWSSGSRPTPSPRRPRPPPRSATPSSPAWSASIRSRSRRRRRRSAASRNPATAARAAPRASRPISSPSSFRRAEWQRQPARPRRSAWPIVSKARAGKRRNRRLTRTSSPSTSRSAARRRSARCRRSASRRSNEWRKRRSARSRTLPRIR